MDWYKIAEYEDGTSNIVAGWKTRRRDGYPDEYACAFWYDKVYDSNAGGLCGYLNFPQRAEAHFAGTRSALNKLCKSSPSATALLADKRWNFYT